MEYISDRIGKDYLSWNNQFILISTRTGSGKTQFILNQLLKQAINKHKFILYICNRRLLQQQVGCRYEEAIAAIGEEELSEDQKHHLIVRTYQMLEKRGFDWSLNVPEYDRKVEGSDILYYVWDEAHYLGTETFNASFNCWFQRFFSDQIGFPDQPSGTHIFLTATPEPLKLFLAAHLGPPPGKKCIPEMITYFERKKTTISVVEELKEGFKERAALYQEADEKEKEIKENPDGKRTTEKIEKTPEEQKKIQDEADSLRKQAGRIHPGANSTALIRDTAQRLCSFTVKKTGKPLLTEYAAQGPSPYETMPTTYCTGLSDLLEPIRQAVQHEEKFVVFVDDIEEGKELFNQLADQHISTCFITAQHCMTTPTPKEDPRKHLVEDSQFEQSVLIATSVLDCGVNIEDDAVKHVAIRNADQTTFLQMLGRKRLKEGEQIHLYIIAISSQRIYSLQRTMLQMLHDMQLYRCKDDKVIYHDKKMPLGETYDEAPVYPEYGEETQKYIVDRIVKGNMRDLLYRDPVLFPKNTSTTDVLKRYHAGSSVLIRTLCCYQELSELIEQAGPKPPRYFYLTHQLSWLNQTYDSSKWYGMAALADYLESNLESTIVAVGKGKNGSLDNIPCNCIDSDTFSRDCVKYAPGITSKIMKMKKELEKKGTVPKIKLLNSLFQELGLHYHLTSKQVKKWNCSVWDLQPFIGPIEKPGCPKCPEEDLVEAVPEMPSKPSDPLYLGKLYAEQLYAEQAEAFCKYIEAEEKKKRKNEPYAGYMEPFAPESIRPDFSKLIKKGKT